MPKKPDKYLYIAKKTKQISMKIPRLWNHPVKILIKVFKKNAKRVDWSFLKKEERDMLKAFLREYGEIFDNE